MKTKRATNQIWALLAAVAILAPLSVAIFERSASLAQSEPNRKADAHIDGKLVIDGSIIQLKSAYALKREAPLPYKGAIIDLFLTNQPLPEDLLSEVLAEKYHGSNDVRGIWLIFDAAGALRETEFLLQTGFDVRNQTSIKMMGGEHKIENDRITGMLEYHNQRVTGSIGFKVTFDVPLNDVKAHEKPITTIAEPKTVVAGSAQVMRSYRFKTATVNSKGAIIKRAMGRGRYYVEEGDGLGLEMVEVRGGSFTMGSSGVYEAHPAHPVSVPSFYMSKYEVTQAQWRAVASLPRILRHLDPDPSRVKDSGLPVDKISWEDAIEFCARLTRATGRTYRLPSEAEWEYACRAGSETPFAFGETINLQLVNYQATYPDGSKRKPGNRVQTTPVGSLGVANKFGLYDMHGNVAEWCMDPWHDFYIRAPRDGSVWEAGGDESNRVMRGGSWENLDSYCRADSRSRESMSRSYAGVRIVADGAPETAPIRVAAKTRSTGVAAMPAKHGAGLKLRDFEFETVYVDLNGQIESRRKGQARAYTEKFAKLSLELVEIAGGAFKMGYSEDDQQRPIHLVNVPSFYMGKYEVTQAQWKKVAKLPKVKRNLKPDPSKFKGDNLPVDSVSWDEAMEFCLRLSRATGRRYCLPTEAEWEYAGRGGTMTEFALGDNITPDLVNYDGRLSLGSAPEGVFRKQTSAVGSLGVANGFGLFDMDGNVREWCLDVWHKNYNGAPKDGGAWLNGGVPASRVTRGGSWDLAAHMCRVADRNWCPRDSCRLEVFGFRVALNGRGSVGPKTRRLR